MAVRSKGFQGIVGRKVGSVWGTAVAVGSGYGLEVINLDMGDAGTDLIEDMQITGRTTQREGLAGNKLFKPKFSTGLRYEGNGKDIAQVFGTAGVPSTVDTSGKKHVFKIKDNIDGIFNTLAYEYVKDTFVAELASVKWTKLTIKGEQGQKIILEVEGIGFDWTNASVTNDTTTIDTITLPSGREFALFSQLVMLMNANSGGGLAAGTDDVYISAFEITIERALEPRVSTRFGNRTDEPIDNGFLKVSGSFTVPAIQNDTVGGNTALDVVQAAATRQKAKFLITSPNLAGASTAYYQHVLWLPNLQLGKGRPGIPGPQGPTRVFPFEAHHVATVPTGFTSGYLDAVTWENVNVDATDGLA